MVLVVLVVAGIGFGVAKMVRYYTKLQRKGLLDPPVNLLEGVYNQAAWYFRYKSLSHHRKQISNQPKTRRKPRMAVLASKNHPGIVTPKLRLGSGSKRAKHNSSLDETVLRKEKLLTMLVPLSC